ncbi:hypothetical protein CTAYLR_002377 [Chrysophaeum taylorii]|uniref:PhoD-like phosphatase metallophosphatase domain-containing protein n=1 Tax=Chrysophaeum taylorii TaxID=2483200 RepID=A0AAD7XN49_9STRA|nr:hypothetical protein CTAYLR_002377 [Chrysophaeum taylorii]
MLHLFFGRAMAAVADYHHHHPFELRTAAVASCNKQHRPQPLWAAMLRQTPQAFFWAGDSVYPNRSDVDALRAALQTQKARPEYHEFRRRVPVISGTWDDHDLGINDAGRRANRVDERRAAFLDFINATSTYSAHEFGPPDRRVLFVLLDTRSYRDDHLVPSVGAWFRNIPGIGRFMPLVAAASRLFAGALGLPRLFGFDGDVLGEDQWRWLETVLAGATPKKSAAAAPAAAAAAKFVVLVSSIQVTTSNPSFESWDHFPKAKDRLFEVLRRTKPNGLLVLSGDVHHAEILGSSADVCGGFVEVTTSGMTHTLATSRLTRLLFPPLLRYFRAHRPLPTDYATALNYARLTFDWDHLTLSVHVLGEEDRPLLRPVTVASCPFDDPPPSRCPQRN